MMRAHREAHWYNGLMRAKRAILLPLWLIFGLPVHITRTVMGAVWSGVDGAAGATAGFLAAVLGVAIAVPVVAFVLGLIFALVPLVIVAVAMGMAFALLTWPFRYYLWRLQRRRSWRRWFYGLDEPGEKEDPWRR